MPYSEQLQQTERGPASVYQPSPFSQMVGGAALYQGLTGEDGVFGDAEGGYIRGYAKGGLVAAADVINLNADDYWEVA